MADSRACLKTWGSACLLLLFTVVPLALIWSLINDVSMSIFFTVLTLRYSRLLGHMIGWLMYTPAKTHETQTFRRCDVTVIVPTVCPSDIDFVPCLQSILANEPARLLVVTVGEELHQQCLQILDTLRPFGPTQVAVTHINYPNKRHQIVKALAEVQSAITVLADDHVFWPVDFLPHLLAPFDCDRVGGVATKKKVIRNGAGKFWSPASILNFIAVNYLERHSWELQASDGLDSGLFVISGRTAAYLTSFLKSPDVVEAYSHEKFFFGLLGGDGMAVDDDNQLSRSLVSKGYQMRFQDSAVIQTNLGLSWKKFGGQLTRWARTTIRSNPAMLKKGILWKTMPWSGVNVFAAALFNYSLLWDSFIFYTLVNAGMTSPAQIATMVIIVVATKLIKILPCFCERPADILLIPYQILFAYIHSFFKLYATLTFFVTSWGGRNLQDLEGGDQEGNQSFTFLVD